MKTVLNEASTELESAKQNPSPNQALRELRLTIKRLHPLKYNGCAIIPYPDILHEIYLLYLNAEMYAPACTVLAHIIDKVDPFIHPEPWHPSRLINLWSLVGLLQQLMHPPTPSTHRYPYPSKLGSITPMIPRQFAAEFSVLDAAYAVLALIDHYVPRSYGRESRFACEVHEELTKVAAIEKEIGVDKIDMNEMKDEKGKGHEFVTKQFVLLREMGDYAWLVIDHVDIL